MSTPSSAAQSAHHQHPAETIKETLISIVIAFTMAFVFRGFVIEAFVIPTGSMAPTLMGAHMRYHGNKSGHDWPVSAVYPLPNDPTSYQNPQRGINVSDPITGEVRSGSAVELSSGDRILVLKYLYSLFDPQRYDVIVFKNPFDPSVNYIKRLVGLPGEQVALIDGDVFVRTPKADDPKDVSPWALGGWSIARKPAPQQRAVWQMVYDSSLEALAPAGTPAGGPWATPDPTGWTLKPREYVYSGSTRADLVFDQSRQRTTLNTLPPQWRTWAISDAYAYNEALVTAGQPLARFPVADVRVHAGVKPQTAGLTTTVALSARGHEFRAVLGTGKAELQMRAPAGGSAGGPVVLGPWTTMATAAFPGFPADRVTSVELWHADQRLTVFIDGTNLVHADYDWTPDQRLRFATGLSLADVLRRQNGLTENVLADAGLYTLGALRDLRFTFEGAPVTLYRVGVDRDLYYQPATKTGQSQPALATSPTTTLTLGPDQFFPCGDNSPASLDGRLMTHVDDWVYKEFPPPAGDQYSSVGVIPRELLLGRAFFVYWPSLLKERGPLPMTDFGRMRFIW